MSACSRKNYALSWGLLNYVSCVPSCPTCLTGLRALRSYVLYVLTCLTCLMCLYAFVSLPLKCLPFLHVLRALNFLRALCAFIFFTCLTCLHFSTCLTCPNFFYVHYLPLLFLRTFIIFLRAFRAFTFLKVSNFWRTSVPSPFFLKSICHVLFWASKVRGGSFLPHFPHPNFCSRATVMFKPAQ